MSPPCVSVLYRCACSTSLHTIPVEGLSCWRGSSLLGSPLLHLLVQCWKWSPEKWLWGALQN